MSNNKERQLVKIIKEIAFEKDINLKLLSKSWIIGLEKKLKKTYIFGYNFELNTATAKMLAQDKAATSEIMQLFNIPVVEHQLFMHPKKYAYIDEKGVWKSIFAFFEANNNVIVCKPNTGTGGNNIHLVKSQTELETAVFKLLKQGQDIALSPFYDILAEYRLVYLDGEILIAYTKKIPELVGDGRFSNLNLLYEIFDLENPNEVKKANGILTSNYLGKTNWNEVLSKGETLKLNWQHNLGKGAKAELVTDKNLINNLTKIATQAASAINIRFASIDIVQTTAGDFRLMEINSGMMLEKFSQQSAANYQLAKKVYEKAIEILLEI